MPLYFSFMNPYHRFSEKLKAMLGAQINGPTPTPSYHTTHIFCQKSYLASQWASYYTSPSVIYLHPPGTKIFPSTTTMKSTINFKIQVNMPYKTKSPKVAAMPNLPHIQHISYMHIFTIFSMLSPIKEIYPWFQEINYPYYQYAVKPSCQPPLCLSAFGVNLSAILTITISL